jgi:hypothetical protein
VTSWMFVANITNELIVVLDVLHAHNVSVDLGCHVLQLGEEKCLHGVLGHKHILPFI